MKPKTQQTKPCEEPLFFEDKRTKNVVLIDDDKDKTAENNQETDGQGFGVRTGSSFGVDGESTMGGEWSSSPDLNSQLNPSGCGRDCNIKGKLKICGYEKDNFLCPICSAKRLATAKALYNEKKKELKRLHFWRQNVIDLEKFIEYKTIILINIDSRITDLESEIKQIANEVPEVKE